MMLVNEKLSGLILCFVLSFFTYINLSTFHSYMPE